MKKIILILMAALPVLIVFFTALGAGAIISEIKTFPVDRIEIDYDKLETSPVQNYINLKRGGTLNFADYIKVYPEKARFSSLVFESKMPEVVDVKDGVLTAKQYQRNNNRIAIDVKTGDGLKTFVTFNVQIEVPPPGEKTDIIDYIGFDLSEYMSDKAVYRSYCSAGENGELIIDRRIMDNENVKSKFNVLDGLVVGPFDAFSYVAEALEIEDLDGVLIENENDDYTYTIIGEGEVTVTASFTDKSGTLKTATLKIIIKEIEEAAA